MNARPHMSPRPESCGCVPTTATATRLCRLRQWSPAQSEGSAINSRPSICNKFTPKQGNRCPFVGGVDGALLDVAGDSDDLETTSASNARRRHERDGGRSARVREVGWGAWREFLVSQAHLGWGAHPIIRVSHVLAASRHVWHCARVAAHATPSHVLESVSSVPGWGAVGVARRVVDAEWDGGKGDGVGGGACKEGGWGGEGADVGGRGDAGWWEGWLGPESVDGLLCDRR